jgi:hypothetical protein
MCARCTLIWSWRNWQTHQLEGLAVAIPWWFESTRPHQNPGPRVGASGNFIPPHEFLPSHYFLQFAQFESDPVSDSATHHDLGRRKVKSRHLKCRKFQTLRKLQSLSLSTKLESYDLNERNSTCIGESYLGDSKGHSTLTASLRRYLLATSLVFLTCSLVSQAQPKITRTAKIDLHTHPEGRVQAQIKFDTSGRILILYRDKYTLISTGNWHLIRLTGPFSGELKREEIDFSIPQESVEPEPARRWDFFPVRLLLSPDGSRAFAIFKGSVVRAKSGPPPFGAIRNVRVDIFESLVSFDLTAFRVSASADVTRHPNDLVAEQISTAGDLLLLYSTDTDWKIVSLDGFLHEVQGLNFSAAPVEKSLRSSCWLRPDLNIECPMRGRGDLLLGSDSVVRLAESTCKMRPGPDAFGVGKDKTVKDYVIETDRLCTRDESGNENLVSADLLPRCPQGWNVAAISPDHRSMLTSCILGDLFLDSFSYISQASLQLIDVPTLAVRATIPLSKRHRSSVAVFHRVGTSTIAVIEDGTTLLVYNAAD